MHRTFFNTACLICATGVMAGAFGAHFLKERLAADMLGSFETAVRYQLLHSLALLVISSGSYTVTAKYFKTAAWLFVAGIVMFSGSIYLLSTRALTGIDGLSALGPVTPLGGICFISGWLLLAAGQLKDDKVK